MHILVLDANTDRSEFAARHPDERGKFHDLLSPLVPEWCFTGFKVCDGDFPETLTGFDGAIISGSPASVNSGEDWVARLEALIRELVSNGAPVFGACFGHQAIATALGGTVGPNPHGWVLGVETTTATAPSPWMQTAQGTTTRQHAAHKEQVLTLPKGTRVLSTAPNVPVAQMAIGSQVFSTQYHPEITHDFMCELIEEMDGSIPKTALQTARDSMSDPAHTATIATWIINFFQTAQTL